MSAPRPILNEMPDHIKKQILENIPFERRSRCRRVCKWFKTFLDKMELVYHVVTLDMYPTTNTIHLSITNLPNITICQTGDRVRIGRMERRKRNERFIENANYFEVAAKMLCSLMSAPNALIFHLSIQITNGTIENQESFLTAACNITNGFNARKLSFWLMDNSASIPRFVGMANRQHLKNLILFKKNDTRTADDFRWLVESGILQNLTQLGIAFPTTGIRYEDVKHLHQCNIFPENFTLDTIKALKAMPNHRAASLFAFRCSRKVKLSALKAEFGPYTMPAKRRWEFPTRDRRGVFAIQTLKEWTPKGYIYNGCDVMLETTFLLARFNFHGERMA